jgi:hypothetical protein
MNIITEEQIISKESLPQIIKKMFVICKEDPQFKRNKDIKDVETRIEELSKKEQKQNELLEKANQMKEDLLRKLSILEDENESLKTQLLEKLGCEI